MFSLFYYRILSNCKLKEMGVHCYSSRTTEVLGWKAIFWYPKNDRAIGPWQPWDEKKIQSVCIWSSNDTQIQHSTGRRARYSSTEVTKDLWCWLVIIVMYKLLYIIKAAFTCTYFWINVLNWTQVQHSSDIYRWNSWTLHNAQWIDFIKIFWNKLEKSKYR